MSTQPPTFDPIKYKETTRDQWQTAAEAWHRWAPTLQRWLGDATQAMLDMANLTTGQSVLDVAAGAGDQTIQIAKRVGPDGYVLATDISSNILEFAQQSARRADIRGGRLEPPARRAYRTGAGQQVWRAHALRPCGERAGTRFRADRRDAAGGIAYLPVGRRVAPRHRAGRALDWLSLV